MITELSAVDKLLLLPPTITELLPVKEFVSPPIIAELLPTNIGVNPPPVKELFPFILEF